MLDITRAYGLNFLYPEGDDSVGQMLRDYGEFAPAELGFIAQCLSACESEGTFLDIGANIGAICLPLATGRDTWRFIAVEGHRGLAQVLSANAFANGRYNVEVHNAVVGAAEGLIDFPALSLKETGNFGIVGLHMEQQYQTERARMTTIDALAPSNTRFIKVDVEGHEAEVLRGAEQTLHVTRPIWLLEANVKHEKAHQEMRSVLFSAGYDLYWFYSPFVSLNAPSKKSAVPPRRKGDFSVVALPKGTANLWELPKVADAVEPLPTLVSLFPYLQRFGY
ncbi:FkbM family methyltransferase [Caulobacter henricii]|uniref:Methyltransferase FkbM domain-containing protein n=1 Tax=Caulobacter henricii TaxID=69395 RepID=A0A0N7JH49_9CAUL|nr:FkbM family methyltransferase [Caulobacter henricii]ALL12402.1 hypothetical protein AQ619_02965 [Caulobacter henricii]